LVENLKDLEKLLRLCRKQGVSLIEWGGVKLTLGDLPPSPAISQPVEEPSLLESLPEGFLTPEQIMYYSAGGVAGKDPSRD
jgi:hypothetical protein